MEPKDQRLDDDATSEPAHPAPDQSPRALDEDLLPQRHDLREEKQKDEPRPDPGTPRR